MLVCSECGNLRSECSNPSIDWHPNTTVCYASAASEWGQRMLAKKNEGVAAVDGAEPLDGVSIYVTREPPEVDPLA